nr:hypothetical protein [Tanacetum cinerariifolium]
CVLSWIAICLGLRFAYLKTFFLRFAKDRFCQTQNSVAFCPGLHFVLDCVLSKTLRFALEEPCVLLWKNLAFCFRRTLRFVYRVHCVLLQETCVLSLKHCALPKVKNLAPNGEALKKCILSGPCKPTTVLVQAAEATDDSPVILEHMTVETPMNMSPENKAHFLAEKEVIHLIFTRFGDEIYSTINACQTAQEMREAIKRLQQGESLNIQDVKTNLFWEFRKFTLHDGETMKSYYTRFYKLMNEMIRNNLTVTTMQVNVQFLQQFQPEWSRKPKRVKDSAYHKEKMLLCKQAEQGVLLQAEQYDWLADTDEEVDEHELEAHYSYMAKIQEVPTADTGTDSEPVEQ